jgi:hypothetical protein
LSYPGCTSTYHTKKLVMNQWPTATYYILYGTFASPPSWYTSLNIKNAEKEDILAKKKETGTNDSTVLQYSRALRAPGFHYLTQGDNWPHIVWVINKSKWKTLKRCSLLPKLDAESASSIWGNLQYKPKHTRCSPADGAVAYHTRTNRLIHGTMKKQNRTRRRLPARWPCWREFATCWADIQSTTRQRTMSLLCFPLLDK